MFVGAIYINKVFSTLFVLNELTNTVIIAMLMWHWCSNNVWPALMKREISRPLNLSTEKVHLPGPESRTGETLANQL